jgi:O-acetyl-ADP-ribose deacetylase (regulator of RNase III)
MITYVYGDLFQSPAKVLVNTVNTVGVMGKGIAADFKHFYPEMFEQYQRLCEAKQFNIGQLWLYKTSHKWILNFPTKIHWRNKSKPEYIEAGLRKFADTYDQRGITSISFPLLGCGNGELDWESEVKPLMEKYLASLPINVYIHYYQAKRVTPEHRDIENIRKWLHGEPQSLPFAEFWDDLRHTIAPQKILETFDTREQFTVSIVDGGVRIGFYNDQSLAIPEEILLELWQYIRSAGYIMPQKLPFGLDRYARYIISLLGELEYLRGIRLSTKDGEPLWGLQLIPNTQDETDIELLSLIPEST